MRELRAALDAEGPSDALFLPRVLTRALEDTCLSMSVDLEVRDVSVLRVRRGGGHRVDDACAEAKKRPDHLFFFHYDGTADSSREKRKHWEPFVAEWRQRLGDRALVAVVPVREMEAWALADKAALLAVVGSDWPGRGFFQADRPADVERLEDPKFILQEVSKRGRGRRRRARKPEEYLPRIADELSLEALRDVPSFRQWSVDTVEALRKMRYLP